MNKDFNLNDDVIMKKQHACGTNLWVITINVKIVVEKS